MRLYVLFAAMAVSLGAFAGPVPEDTPDGLLVRTSHYVARISKTTGFLAHLATAQGEDLITGSRIYCDVLPDGRKNFSPRALAPPRVVRSIPPQPELAIETTGQLVDGEGKIHPKYPFTYRIRYEFPDSSPRIRVQAWVVPGFEATDIHGFLAHVFSLAPHREFFAQTEEGRISQLASDHSTRVYQSEQEPLSQTDPSLGVLLETGGVLRLRIQSEDPPLQNVFLHDRGKHQAALFLANMSGNMPLKAEEGKAWIHVATLEAMTIADLFPKH